MEFRVLAPLGSRVGESPVWDDRRGALFVCDILAPAIHLVTLDGAVQATWRFDRPAGSIGLTESGRLIVALGRDLAVFDPDTGSLAPLASVPEPESNRLNDGKVGPDGCFYVGSMDDRPEKEPLGVLYRVHVSGSVEPVAGGFKGEGRRGRAGRRTGRGCIGATPGVLQSTASPSTRKKRNSRTADVLPT